MADEEEVGGLAPAVVASGVGDSAAELVLSDALALPVTMETSPHTFRRFATTLEEGSNRRYRRKEFISRT
jgi:hypothetical protein